MLWGELVKKVAAESGVDEQTARSVLNRAMKVASGAVASGESVTLRNLGTISNHWRGPRTVRSISDQQQMVLSGRYVPRFKASRPLRDRLARRTPQHWRSPGFQSAWQLAETLVCDLDLYHGDRAPRLETEMADEETLRLCEEAFGGLWRRVRSTWEKETPAVVRAHIKNSQRVSFLGWAARRQWAD